MEEIQIRRRNRNRNRRVVAQVRLPVLKADRRQFTYRPVRLQGQRRSFGAASMGKLSNRLKESAAREAVKLSAPNRKRASVVADEEIAGSAWTEKWFSSRKGMFGQDARNVTDRKQKRIGIVLLILLNKHVGVALTDRSSRPAKRIARREKVNATVLEKKRASIVAEKNKRQRRPRRRIIERRQRRIQLRSQRRIRRRNQQPIAPVTPTTNRKRIRY